MKKVIYLIIGGMIAMSCLTSCCPEFWDPYGPPPPHHHHYHYHY